MTQNKREKQIRAQKPSTESMEMRFGKSGPWLFIDGDKHCDKWKFNRFLSSIKTIHF